MELAKLAENVYYFAGPVNMGLVVNQNRDALLVDTGIDDSVARKVRRLLEENNFNLRGIIITHAHADHCGGAPYLAKSTGARVYAAALEKTVLEFPIWEPLYLFAGAYPPSPMHNKFLLAPGVQVHGVVKPGMAVIEGCAVEIVDLAGHTLGQIGVAAGGVFFCADAVFAPDVIAKHGIPLHAHLASSLETFNLLESRRDNCFVPAHGRPVNDVHPLVAANRERIEAAADFILGLAKNALSAEEILAAACDAFNIKITDMSHYYLMHLTVMAYLGHLLDRGKITVTYDRNRQIFVRNAG